MRTGALRWAVLALGLAVFPAALEAAEGDVPLAPMTPVEWLVTLVVGALLTSGWFWLGARLFHYKVPYGRCLVVAAIPPVLLALGWYIFWVAVFVTACLGTFVGIVAVLLLLVAAFVAYVYWIDDFMGIDSEGVTAFLVVTVVVADLAIAFAARLVI